MADTKISALPASTVPLAGTEVLPIVQSSTTKQVSVANLTAGRSFDALGMTLTSTDAGAAAAPLLELYRDSASPAASDTLGEIEFNGEDSAGNKQAYGLIHASILSPTSTAEQGQIHFETATAGALTEKMIIGTTNLVINEIGAVFNVRIEGDTDANLFCTDATNSRVGVGTVGPTAKLDVVGGDIRVDNGNLIIGTSGKGIDFSITSHPAGMTSELLSDYEEGTWTPTIFGYTIAGVTTYTQQQGAYRKIGNQVTIWFWAAWTAQVGGVGSTRLGGLPFGYVNTAIALTATAIGSSNVAYTSGKTLMAGYGFIGTPATELDIVEVGASAAAATLPIAATGSLFGTVTYTV
jgi:hypothetical protein